MLKQNMSEDMPSQESTTPLEPELMEVSYFQQLEKTIWTAWRERNPETSCAKEKEQEKKGNIILF